MDGNQKKVERIPYLVMPNYTEQLERKYQNSIIKLFSESLEYKYLGDFQYQNNAKVNNQGRVNSPIIEEELYAYLDEAGYTDMQISEALRQLKDRARLSDRKFVNLLDTNNNVYELLISGVSAKPTPEENEKDVMFFNFDEPLKAAKTILAIDLPYIVLFSLLLLVFHIIIGKDEKRTIRSIDVKNVLLKSMPIVIIIVACFIFIA